MLNSAKAPLIPPLAPHPGLNDEKVGWVVLALDRAQLRVIRAKESRLEIGFKHVCLVRVRGAVRTRYLLHD